MYLQTGPAIRFWKSVGPAVCGGTEKLMDLLGGKAGRMMDAHTKKELKKFGDEIDFTPRYTLPGAVDRCATVYREINNRASESSEYSAMEWFISLQWCERCSEYTKPQPYVDKLMAAKVQLLDSNEKREMLKERMEMIVKEAIVNDI
eukprot:GHVQ01038176.1.p1 GENE.GHVQ01038176.1~~GHVQ01038176.1.p1  ORF type:complete len:147 (-),score=22.25 GHVQ01038176.1:515-955(-)